MGWIVPRIIVAVLFIAGLGVIFMGLKDIWQAASSATWPTTTAVIVRSDIARRDDDSGNSFVPDIEYRYTVDGQDLTSKGLRAGMKVLYSRKVARSVANEYHAGQLVMIAYDPANPSNALLEPGLHKQTFVAMVFGATALMFVTSVGLAIWTMVPCGPAPESAPQLLRRGEAVQ